MVARSTTFLTLEQILVIHDDQIERYGGRHGLRDLSLIESAIMRPQTTFGGKDLYPSVFEKAAAMMHSLIFNHPFQDGNKRTGTVSALVFLKLNDYDLVVSQEQLFQSALKIESKDWDVTQLSSWLKKHSRKKHG